MTGPAIALLPWGDVWEDYLDMIGISLEEFLAEEIGGGPFEYVEALKRVDIRPVLIVWSREARQLRRRIHVPTGTVVWVLPAARVHLAARRFRRVGRLFLQRIGVPLDEVGNDYPNGFASPSRAGAINASGRWTHRLRRAASLVVSYTATTPRDLARVLTQEQCGAVLVQEYEYPRFDVCVLLGRRLGLPVLAHFQSGTPSESWVERWVRQRTVPAAAGLLVGPRREAHAVAARYQLPPSHITVVPNAIDPYEWTPGDRTAARAELDLPANVPVACWNGRVTIERKGLDVLVEAWRLLCAERPGVDLRLLLCGGGAESARLQRLIAAADLRGVHWHDEYTLDRAVIRRRLVASDVFVLPSRREGFAVAPLEAMACGRPVVACDAPGMVDQLAGGERACGVVVPRENPKALATELGRLLDDRALAARLGEAARRRVVERYSPEAVGATLASTLHKAAPDRFPAPPSLLRAQEPHHR